MLGLSQLGLDTGENENAADLEASLADARAALGGRPKTTPRGADRPGGFGGLPKGWVRFEDGSIGPAGFVPFPASDDRHRAGERGQRFTTRQAEHNRLRDLTTNDVLLAITRGKGTTDDVTAAGHLVQFFRTSLAPSTQSMAAHLARLEVLQGQLVTQGDTKGAAIVGGYIKSLGAQLQSILGPLREANQATAAAMVRANELRAGERGVPNVDVDVTVNVTPRQIQTSTTTQHRYGDPTGSSGRRAGPTWKVAR
jgi:hypothetical protein